MSSWRLHVKLKSRRALLEAMEFHDIPTAYALAKAAGILPGTAGHLVSGRRSTCSIRTARAIEGALKFPPGWLFDSRLSEVVSDTRRGDAA